MGYESHKKLDGEKLMPGTVYLVGAGPGDPELLTRKAYRLLQEASIVCFDHLVTAEILDLIPHGTPRLYVGKQSHHHHFTQNAINHLLVELAQQYGKVVRLKGGDPFIFGRGGEELDQLVVAGIPFEIIPGITAATGVAAYVGIPLTHRKHASLCIWLSGHRQEEGCELNWPLLVQPRQTLVIYMGLTGLLRICQQLVQHGMNPQTPCVLVQQATTRQQRIWRSVIQELPQMILSEQVKAPTLLLVGEVVGLYPDLSWFDASAADSLGWERSAWPLDKTVPVKSE